MEPSNPRKTAPQTTADHLGNELVNTFSRCLCDYVDRVGNMSEFALQVHLRASDRCR